MDVRQPVDREAADDAPREAPVRRGAQAVDRALRAGPRPDGEGPAVIEEGAVVVHGVFGVCRAEAALWRGCGRDRGSLEALGSGS